jgi:hypothetical protein
VNTLLAGLTYTPDDEFRGYDTLHLSVTSSDGSNTYAAQATAATAITVTEDEESLIVGGPGPTLDWNDPANWSRGFVPTLGTNVTIDAPSNYTVIITGTPDAQAASLTIPHGAASTDVTVRGTLQLDGDLNVSESGKLGNDGTLEEAANATFIGPITNNGTIIVDPNIDLDVAGTITGIGKFWIDSGATLEFALASKVAPGTTDSQIIYFEQGAGKLVIDDWGKFAGVITGTDIGTHLTSTDLIDLTRLPYVRGSMSISVSYDPGTNISTMTFSDGISANNETLHLSGNYTGTAWTFTSINGGAGTEVFDPPAESGTVTSRATGQMAAASVATTDANAGGTNTSLVPGNSQNFAGQIVGFTGDGTAGTLSASQTFTRPPTTSAGGYGTFLMTAAGAWAYMPDNNSALNALNTGDTLTDINGSNWNDVIIGGFGAGLLTGGDGNNTFVNSSVADSNAARFDTITHFVSGTDKIDLTALGAFDSAVLALTPTSTSVPEHTIAWRFDSKAHETIVYANPTDQTLSIGNSGLVEIHLQGIATIHSSNFTHAPPTTGTTVVAATDPIDLAATTLNDATIVTTPTADVSSDATVSKGAPVVDWNWTAQTTNIGDSFDATLGHLDSVDHAKIASLDEGRTFSTENSVDDAAITLPSGQSTETPHGAVTALMQISFAFDQKPVFGSADAMTIDHRAVMHGPTLEGGDWIVPSGSDWKVNPETSPQNQDHEASIPKDAGPMNTGDTDAREINTSPDVVLDSEILKTPESDSDNRSIASDAGEHRHDAGAHDFEPSSIAQLASWGTVGTPGDSFHFKDEISGSRGAGLIDVAELRDTPASMSRHEDAAGTHGPLAISEGGETPGTLGDSFHFKDGISSSKGSGVIDVAELDQIPASSSHHDDAAATHGPPAISDGAQALELSLPGQHSADHFNIVPDHAQSAVVTHVPHDLIV